MTVRDRRFLLVLLSGMVALPACQPAPPAASVLSDHLSPVSFPATADVTRSATTGALERVRGENLAGGIEQSRQFRESRANGDYGGMALAFLDAYRQEFRLEDTDGFLVRRVNADRLGFHQVRLSQAYRGLRVLDAELIVHFDPDDRIYLAEGRYLPTPGEVAPDTALSEQEARRALADAVGNDFTIEAGELVVLLPSVAGSARMAYRFAVSRGLIDRREILVDAGTGRTLRDIPLVLNSR